MPKPEQTGEVVIVNNKDEDFAGTLRVDAPAGFAVTPAVTPLSVARGQRMAVTLQAAVGENAEPGKSPVLVKLHRPDGTIESQHEATLEHLGDRRRVVLQVSEDAHVVHSSPTTNYGTNNGLNVDGGDRQMGDQHHGITYLKFRIQLNGTPVSARLRLYNGDNPSVDSGQIRVVTEPWTEKGVTYDTRPKLGDVVAKIGRVTENQVVELPLDCSLESVRELSLAIDPTSCDGINYISREGGKPPELIVEYVE